MSENPKFSEKQTFLTWGKKCSFSENLRFSEVFKGYENGKLG